MKRYLFYIFILIPLVSNAQKDYVEVIDRLEHDSIILIGKNNSDFDQNIELKLFSSGFGFKTTKVTKGVLPANSEREIIRFAMNPDLGSSYSYDLTHSPIINEKANSADFAEKYSTLEVENAVRENNGKWLKLYISNDCDRCKHTTDFFKEHKIRYETLNFSKNERNKAVLSDLLFANGYKGGRFKPPVIVIGEKVFFDIDDLDSFLSVLAQYK